jgi:tetratricopeptide (TPR) repeat protein
VNLRRAVLGVVLAAALCATAGAAPATVTLTDGRVLRGRNLTTGNERLVLDTAFGPLTIPRSAVGGDERRTTDAPPQRPRGSRRETKTKWFVIESDLSDARAKLYADQLDGFFDWMTKVFDIEPKAAARRAPYRAFVYTSREDFKKVQNDVAPGIAASKGSAFGEGVAGFFSPASFRLYLWDVEGESGESNLMVAKHETTHLLNQLLSETHAIKLPQWFNEGGATYFEVCTVTGAGASEPDDEPGALGTVVDEIESGKPMTAREIRSVGYDKFLGREYCWGWALVRWFRKYQGGKKWPALLAHLRTVGSGEGVSDSEDKRFLASVAFKDDESFDKQWHASLVAARPGGRSGPVGTSPAALAAVEAIAKPTPEQARNFARLGVSFERVEEHVAAVAYLKAAMRGGDRSGETLATLARAIAGVAGADEADAWPDETMPLLTGAVEASPLRAKFRAALGRQLLCRAKTPEAAAAARDALGLALVVSGPDDAASATATVFLRAAAAASPNTPAGDIVTKACADLPEAAAALRAGQLYFLQEDRRWDELTAVLEARAGTGSATFEERTMLAGMYKASERAEDAEKIYAALIVEHPAALQLWADRIACLFAMGKREQALAAKKQALDLIAKDPGEWQGVKDRIERLGE